MFEAAGRGRGRGGGVPLGEAFSSALQPLVMVGVIGAEGGVSRWTVPCRGFRGGCLLLAVRGGQGALLEARPESLTWYDLELELELELQPPSGFIVGVAVPHGRERSPLCLRRVCFRFVMCHRLPPPSMLVEARTCVQRGETLSTSVCSRGVAGWQLADEDGLRARIRHSYAQCLSHLWHFPEIWYDLAEYEYSLGEGGRASRVYSQAVTVSDRPCPYSDPLLHGDIGGGYPAAACCVVCRVVCWVSQTGCGRRDVRD